MSATHQKDKTVGDYLLTLIVPLIISVIVGASSAYVATQVTLSTLETKLVYIEKDINKISKTLAGFDDDKRLIHDNASAIEGVMYRISVLETSINNIRVDTKDRYTNTHAKRDLEYVERIIGELKTQVEALKSK